MSSAILDSLVQQVGPRTADDPAPELMLSAIVFDSPLGELVAIGGDSGLALLEFAEFPRLSDQFEELLQYVDAELVPGPHPVLTQTRRELKEYFAGKREEFSVPLDQYGTEFQMLVWENLGRVPMGDSTTYAGLARVLGEPGGARAVGYANSQNRIAILVPCHRVVRVGGKLGGYGGGLDRKRWLLEHEGATVTS